MRRFVSTTELLMFVVAAASPNVALGQTAKPTVTAVTNVASYANSSISPGEMVVIFGAGMGPAQVVTAQLDQQGRVASTLSQVQVLFNGTAAPLIYVSAKQISAMVPYGLAGKSTTQVQVVYQGVASDPFQKPVAPVAPGIFTADSSGQGQAAMTNADGSYNTTATPAAPGSYVTFYLTGEGQTNPPGSDGNIASSTANVALPVTVLIAGRTTQLLYAGSAPGNVNGFAQINAVIPADMQYGGNLPLVVQIGGVSSQTGVTVAVSGPAAPVPGAPQNPTASVNSNAQIVLTWTPADSACVTLPHRTSSGRYSHLLGNCHRPSAELPRTPMPASRLERCTNTEFVQKTITGFRRIPSWYQRHGSKRSIATTVQRPGRACKPNTDQPDVEHC